MTFPATPRFDVVVVGGGIVGLATAHARGPRTRSLGRRARARAAPRHPPDRQQLQRHPLRALLRAGRAERRASPWPAARRPWRSAGNTTCRTRSPASSSSPPSPRSCRGCAELARRGAANGVERARARPGGNAPARAARPRDRPPSTCRPPASASYRAVAEKLGELVAQGGRRDPARPARCCGLVRRREDVVVRTDGTDLLAKQVVVCAGPARRRAGRRPPAPTRASGSSPSAASTRASALGPPRWSRV